MSIRVQDYPTQHGIMLSARWKVMSTAFEGVLCAVLFEEIQSINSQISYNIKFKPDKITNFLSSIYRVEKEKINWKFSSETEYVASQISVVFSKALLVRYDDRVGYRASIIFEEGYPIKSFDLADEIWVMIDENGQPIIHGKKFTTEQIENIENDDNEYETIFNAIQLGLELLGVNANTWRDVHSFITRPTWR